MPSAHLTVATWLAHLLDSRFSIGGFHFGIDPLLNFIPILGPILTMGLSLYLLWIAKQLNAPVTIQSKMVRNLVFDFILGLIPVVGTVSDFIFRANNKNVLLLQEWMDRTITEGEIMASRRVTPAV